VGLEAAVRRGKVAVIMERDNKGAMKAL